LQDVDRAREASETSQALTRAVEEAGALALAKFRTTFRSWTKGESSPVSEVDMAVNDLLRERLTALAPAYGWLSEETADDPARLTARRVWVVDPIDGTRALISGSPDWSVVAALVEQGRPIAGAIFAPAHATLFTAARGGGALRNGERIAASAGDTIDGARMSAPKRQIERLAAVTGRMDVLPLIRSLALRFARIADGTNDVAFASSNPHDWDLAAVDLLVHEAGGALTTLAGRTLTYNGAELVHDALVAAGRARHAALVGLLSDRGSEIA
jgi:myo-inositol-1(or 4)-monophosphatase